MAWASSQPLTSAKELQMPFHSSYWVTESRADSSMKRG